MNNSLNTILGSGGGVRLHYLANIYFNLGYAKFSFLRKKIPDIAENFTL